MAAHDVSSAIDWDAIESAWEHAILAAIHSVAAAHPAEVLYAGAFWMLYGDYTSILPPAFGLNAESAGAGTRWHPADWLWPVVDEVASAVAEHYMPLANLAIPADSFDAVWQRHIDLLSRVSRKVTAAVQAREVGLPSSALAANFFVGIIDFAQGEDAVSYLVQSVGDRTILDVGILEDCLEP